MSDEAEEYRRRCADAVDEACRKLAGIWDNVVIFVNSQNREEGTVAYSQWEGNGYAIEGQVKHWSQFPFTGGPRGVNWIEHPDDAAPPDDNPQSEAPT